VENKNTPENQSVSLVIYEEKVRRGCARNVRCQSCSQIETNDHLFWMFCGKTYMVCFFNALLILEYFL
jgi:hypothetical protein